MTKDEQKELHLSWAELCKSHGVNLTKWELDFVESIIDQLEKGRYLSERQAEILERIYAEKTP
jgi:hypothetical protein